MPPENHHVFLEEASETSLSKTMKSLEAWLGRHNIEPLGRKCTVTPSGSIVVQVTFACRQHASLFEHEFYDCRKLQSAATGLGRPAPQKNFSVR